MSEFERDILHAGPLVWILIVLGASILYRWTRGKPIFYRKPAVVRFLQRSASGFSHRNWFTRLGGANNCLVVLVTETHVDIHPFVPFNWFFLPEIYGMEKTIPLDRISSVEVVKKMFRRRVDIEFLAEDGSSEKMSLY